MVKRLLVAAFVTAMACVAMPCEVLCKGADTGFGGIEFFGSSQITRSELEKELGLKPGASCEATAKAAGHLQEKLTQRRIRANIDVAAEDGRCFVTVDVMDSGVTGVPVRKLENPHKVYLSNEQVFTILDQMFERRELLAQEGRPVTESYVDGRKHFSDEPCNLMGEKLERIVPSMRRELYALILSDPDPVRRSKAVEVLNWDTETVRDCAALIPSVDDGSEQVRASVARFIFTRLKDLPDNFPMADLVEVLSHQLSRPAHMDRMLALRCLTEIARTHPYTVGAIKDIDEDKLKLFEQSTVLNSIRQPAALLLSYCAKAPKATEQRKQVQVNEF